MAKIYGNPLFMSGGGGQNLTLPPMVTNLAAVAGNQEITVSYTNPESDALAGVLVVYKTGSYPTKPTDGKKVDAGLAESVKLEGLENGTDYYIRVYPYNSKKQYQTIIDGATTTARPSEGPKQVTDLQVTGSGASPVLTWKNPTDDPTYTETVVVQKEDSPPTSISDGSEIYRGSGETVTASGLERLKNYYWGVFTVNAEGGTRGPVTTEVYSFDFPAEPESYSMIEDRATSGEFIAPEDGWYQLDAVSKSGDGGAASNPPPDYRYESGGSGGSGAIARKTRIKLNKGEKVAFVINGNVTIESYGINVTQGTNGSGINKGIAGTASGGDENINGLNGIRGSEDNTPPKNGGAAVSTPNNFGLTLTSGYGAGFIGYNPGVAGTGTMAFIRFYRGNTNNPSPSTASTLSLLPTDSTLTVDWTNSGDPVQTGTMLVYNTNHVPKSPSDGVAVDIPLTQPVTLALNSDSEELQEDSKKQSYTIKGVPNNKPVFVALFPYDKDRKYGLAKQEVEIPREHSWYDQRQELESEVETVKAEMADYQSYYTTTQEVLK